MSDWITTPLQSGVPAANHYSCTITDLEPNSVYEYRAYIIVDGVPYCGNIRQITTLSVPAYVPSITTGNAACVTDNSMRICSNIVTDNGNSDICEYGILYTQNPAYSSPTTLIAENYPSLICKKFICAAIPVGQEYFIGSACEITGLAPNTETYYRAFAINSTGNGYGLVKSELTLKDTTVSLVLCLPRSLSSCLNSSGGYVCAHPAIPSGESVNYTLNICHRVVDYGSVVTKICCKPNDSLVYNEIYNCTTTTTFAGNKTIPMYYGDTLCWSHSVNGAAGSCGTLKICSINSYSSGIYPTISSTCFCDKVITNAIPE